MPTYTISGRIVDTHGSPVENATVSVHEIVTLEGAPIQKGLSTPSDSLGTYRISWTDSSAPSQPWDLFVRAVSGPTTVESALICDLESAAVVDIILGSGPYEGRCEWERVAAKVAPLLGRLAIKDISATRLEWLARRSNVFPSHLAAYIQAHRLADQRKVKAETFYAFLRGGLSPNLPELLRAGEPTWRAALRTAFGHKILRPPGEGSPADIHREIDQQVAAMRCLLVEAAVTRPSGGTNHWSLFDTAGIPDAQKREFMSTWVGWSGSLSDFWDVIRQSKALGPARAADFQFTIQAAALVGYHVPALAGLQALRPCTITAVADLAAWDFPEWDNFLVSHSIPAPDNMPGRHGTEKRQNYARGLARAIEDSYPTRSLRHRIHRDTPAHTEYLVDFFDQNPDFDITTANIAHWLAERPNAFAHASDPAQALRNLERVQRVYRLSPRLGRYDTTKTLLDHGIGSAVDVVAYTRSEFIDAFGGLFSSNHHAPIPLAGAVWDMASKINGTAKSLISIWALGNSKANPRVLDGVGQPVLGEEGLEELEAILGTLDYCACDDCRSVFSPAAYLADLLAFLDDRKVLDELTARRPDIPRIFLDCSNTNTPLPYIDLVNEALEATLTGGLGPNSHQTTWTAESLRLHPEHLHAHVYDGPALNEGFVPWILPFSLPQQETCLYLGHLGAARHELMVLLDDGSHTTSEIAAEALGLTRLAWQIIAGEHQGDREFWEFSPAPANDNWVQILNGTDLEAGDVQQLLDRAGLELRDLEELIDLTFIDPATYQEAGAIYIKYLDTCQLGDAKIINLDAPALDRLHRFERLHRITKIPRRMLNVLIDDLGGVLDDAFLRKLADICWLHNRFNVEWDELATWWAPRIDARKYPDGPSLYRRCFYAPELGAPGEFMPIDRGTVLLGELEPQPLTAAHVPVILAATGLTAAEYQLLTPLPATFTFANFTAYFRTASFARANELKVAELVELIELFDVDPFASPADCRSFIAKLDHLRSSGFTARELRWLLHPAHALAPEFRNDEATANMLESLVHTLQAIAAEVEQLSDPLGLTLRANLSSFLKPTIVDELMKILAMVSKRKEADQAIAVTKQFASFTDPMNAVTKLVVNGGEITEPGDRYTWVLRELVKRRRAEEVIIAALASHYRIENDVCSVLLADVLTAPDDDRSLIQCFLKELSADGVDAGPKREVHVGLFRACDRLHKAATIITHFDLRADQIGWYSKNPAWLDLDALPLSPTDASSSHQAWARLCDALSLRTLYPNDVNGHRQLANAGSLTEALAILGKHTGWDVSEENGLGFIAHKLGLTEPTVFADEIALMRLRDVACMAERLGVTARELWSWAHHSLDFALAAKIKQATRAKYDDTQWPNIARPLRDKLRERQRDALVAAACVSLGKSVKGLSDHLLLDVEMSACMLTSRIGQAIASVQTFINRVLLGLEPDLSLASDALTRWAWMKTYRVWEANRKVFLYPENWVEPQLRRGKTPEFVALESALLQGELVEPLVEGALSAYVESLDRLAKLEIVSTFEVHNGLWVVGRTQTTPRQHWVRTREDGRWTPWEPIPLPIQSDNVVIVVRGVRVYLFWLLRDDATEPANNEISRAKDFDYDRLTIAWSELCATGWSEPKLSDSVLVARDAKGGINEENQTIPPNTYLLKTINRTPLIELRAYTTSHSVSETWHFSRFWFNLRTKRVTAGVPGTTLRGGEQISLLSGYGIDGQRFWTTGNHDHEFIDDDPEGWVPDKLVYWATTWSQGPYNVELLRRHQTGYRRSFVLQSDHWATDKVLTPSFFDDHNRKYLITPSLVFDNAGSAKDGVNPGVIGAFGLDAFVGLNSKGYTPPGVQLPFPQGKIKADGLKLVTPTPNANQVLADAKFTVGGVTVVHGDAPAPTPEPDRVCLTLETFHHPFTHMLMSALKSHGVRGLYDPSDSKLLRQSAIERPLEADHLDANPNAVRKPFPVDDFDFSMCGAYSAYNWELFFHVPLLIANKLTAARRFAEAQEYLHAIFNPIDRIEGPGETNGSSMWRMRRFVEQAKSGELFMLRTMLGIGVTKAQRLAALASFANQVEAWLANPFDPHAVAQMRPGAYMRAVVMRYLDNLIAWADDLFRRDTVESIDEARILYLLAAEILGPRPQQVPSRKLPAKSYVALAADLDVFSNAVQALENYIYVSPGDAQLLSEDMKVGWNLVELRFWYFCYPPNPKLLGYWDTIEDRLWKIRHCQNIKGITRQLPLFQPPIDPGLLVAAAAAGLSADSVLGDLAVGLPPYRFRHVLAKAMDFCNELRGLGNTLLSALERRDTELLAQLRSGQEVSLLQAARDIRVEQIEEIEARIQALEWNETTARQRMDYYQGLIEAGLNDSETQHHTSLGQAKERTIMAQGTAALAATLGVIPQLSVGTGAMSEFGGVQLSSAVRSISEWMQLGITDAHYQANKALYDAQYKRREEEWHFQLGQAALDQERVRRELAAAAIQLAIAKRELANHDLRTKQAREFDEFVHGEYTNAELYDWMFGQLLDVYYQVYDLAYDMGKRAEAAYRYELAVEGGPAIVSSGYWEPKRNGLLAGERLSKDLRRLEKAYMERDVREYELRKNVSLAQLDVAALRRLQETGVCEFVIPEVLFDLDHPGHYLRRIRSVSVTIPAVVSTYTSLGAKLILLEDRVRRHPDGPLEARLGGTQMIATSTAVGDAGLFQLDFRDERYLPFEYVGAVSKWRLELPEVLRQFDYRTITDVVVSLAYTARDGGDGYRGEVQNRLVADFNAVFSGGASQLLVVHDAFPGEWEQFLEPNDGADAQSLTTPFAAPSLPYFAQRQGLSITRVEVALPLNDGVAATGAGMLTLHLGGALYDLSLSPTPGIPSCLVGGINLVPPLEELGEWTLTRARSVQPDPDVLDELETGWLDRSKVVGMVLVVRYELA